MNNAPMASAYVHKGRLCILGVAETDQGPIPFAQAVTIEGESEEGPVDMGSELSEPLKVSLSKCQGQIKHQIDREQQRLAVESLVTRTRQGDQNAMAMLISIGENARAGDKRARYSYKVAERFAKSNPIQAKTSFGFEDKLLKQAITPYGQSAAIVVLTPYLEFERMVVLLCDGPPLISQLRNIAKAIPKDEREAFNIGYKQSGNKEAVNVAMRKLPPMYFRAFQVGFAAGVAHRIQNAIKPAGRISDISRMAGWELGE